ncbi:MAG: hypothetical protein QW559_01785 [Candidatus Woesearchaeota archaeon]
MKKVMAIAGLLLALLLLSACAPLRGRQREEQLVPDFRVGSQGLVLSFEPNLPPTRLYDDQPFEAVLRIENRGAFDVGGAGDKVYISGFDPSIITGISTFGAQIPKLEGKSLAQPIGLQDVVQFRGTIRDLRSKGIDQYRTRILGTACYGYQTIATANVCIDPDPYSLTVKQKVCTPQNVALGGGQAAPIAVTNIQLEPSKGKTRFRIAIANVGGGEVFKPGATYLSKCSPYAAEGLRYDEFDYVRLDDVSVAGRSITSTCRPAPDVKLSGGLATVFCELSGIPQGSAFVSPLTITISYGYRSSVVRDITILSSR